MEFAPLLSSPSPSVGLVIKLSVSGADSTEVSFYRITHVFKDSIYLMQISTPGQVRAAKRPKRTTFDILNRWFSSSPQAVWGKVSLPTEFVSVQKTEQVQAFKEMHPLLKLFQNEQELQANRFNKNIQAHAEAVGLSEVTVRRNVLRYWYFGSTAAALIGFTRGPKIKRFAGGRQLELDSDESEPNLGRRRGRQPLVAQSLGPNNFVLGLLDEQEIIACYKKLLRMGPTTVRDAYLEYIRTFFANRHPEAYLAYIDGKTIEPVTERQYRYYIDHWHNDDPKLELNRTTIDRHSTEKGALQAVGPDEIYEIDATVNRVFLISQSGVPLSQPVLYVVIDRWSRYIVGVYVSLKSPSWDEVKYSLLVSFTSRAKRFSRLGVDTSDVSWPPGRIPSVLLADRGAEFRGIAIEKAIADNLRIEIANLPRRTPDGKAIVERVIKELKRRNAARKLKGTYADRPTNFETRALVEKARGVAVYDLQDIYREVINQVEMYNNSTHKTLSKKLSIIKNGVSPTPKSFYMWGRENLTGLSTPPLSDLDYQRMLLGVGVGSVSANGLLFKGQAYVPVNAEAQRILRGKTGRRIAVQVRFDASDPSLVYIETHSANWAEWQLTKGAMEDTRGLTLDEIDARKGETGLMVAKSRHQTNLDEVKSRNNSETPPRKVGAVKNADRPTTKRLGEQETTAIKMAMQGKNTRTKDAVVLESEGATELIGWQKLAAEQRSKAARSLRSKRKKNK